MIGPKSKAHVLLSCKACQAFFPCMATSLPCDQWMAKTAAALRETPMQIVVHSGLHCQLHLRRPSSRLSLRRPAVTINPSWPCLPFASHFLHCPGPWHAGSPSTSARPYSQNRALCFPHTPRSQLKWHNYLLPHANHVNSCSRCPSNNPAWLPTPNDLHRRTLPLPSMQLASTISYEPTVDSAN